MSIPTEVRSPVRTPAPAAELARALGEPGEREYGRLLRLLPAVRGRFALLPVESDLRPAERDALLERLRADLLVADLDLRVVRLSRDDWDLRSCLEEPSHGSMPRVTAVLGLDETPGIIPEAGSRPKRPQALAVLNHLREAVRLSVATPLLLWCDPHTYTTLQEHAPDFFDHYTALFTFLDERPGVSNPVGLDERNRAIGSSSSPSQPRPPGSPAAVRFYEERLEELTEPSVERARMLLGLAEALWSLQGKDVGSRLIRAKAATEEALSLLEQEERGAEWARGQNILGNIISKLPTEDRGANLAQAIACFESALRVYTESDFPQDWARTQNNLGEAYEDLPTGDRGANLARAIACFESALRVFTKADTPQNWARTKNNLGVAYLNRPWGARIVSRDRAIACFESALRVYTESDFPQQWATIQINLGVAYLNGPWGSSYRAYLSQAIACFESALRVFTETDFPREWAQTQFNRGLVLLETGEAELARQAFEASARGFRSVGLEDKAREAEAERDKTEGADEPN